MENLAGQFVSTYLLMPLIAVIAGFVMLFIAKKNNFLNNKKAIFYSILGRKKYIDPDLTLAENNIKEKNVIIAKRTKHNEYP